MEIGYKEIKHLKKLYFKFYTSNITNVRYLSGFTGSSGFLLVTDNEDHFFSDGPYIEQSKNEVHNEKIHITVIDEN